MALGMVRTVLDAAARTASGQSGTVGLDTEPLSQIAVGLRVTAVAGVSPTLTVAVEWSHDGGVTWLAAQAADAFTQVTAATSAVRLFGVKGPHYRVVYTVGGTAPSFTFAVTSVAT